MVAKVRCMMRSSRKRCDALDFVPQVAWSNLIDGKGRNRVGHGVHHLTQYFFVHLKTIVFVMKDLLALTFVILVQKGYLALAAPPINPVNITNGLGLLVTVPTINASSL